METKQKIIQLIEDQLKQSLESFEASDDVYKSSTDLDEESTRDMDDFSQQSTDQDMQMRMQTQAKKVAENITRLETYGQSKQESVKPGALVETKNIWFFIGIALPANMKIEKKRIVGISEDAPIYASIEGKKKGATITIGNQKLKIQNIY